MADKHIDNAEERSAPPSREPWPGMAPTRTAIKPKQAEDSVDPPVHEVSKRDDASDDKDVSSDANGEKIDEMKPTAANGTDSGAKTEKGDRKVADANIIEKATQPLKKMKKTAVNAAMKVAALEGDTTAKAEQLSAQQDTLMAMAEASAEKISKESAAQGGRVDGTAEVVDDFQYASEWNQVWQLIKKNPGMLQDKPSMALLQAHIGHKMANGPTCANRHCRGFGHTLAFCPCPVDMERGDMVGCFFCNVVEHEADDCPMMSGVTVYSLVTYLITNRAGLPPWRTRIDWVALAIDCWDIIDLNSLPLTREFVVTWYVPKKIWLTADDWVDGRSPYDDPLFKSRVDVHKLRQLANPVKGKGVIIKCPHGHSMERPPLMEASPTACYTCDDTEKHYVLRNKW
ncbi:hypothetical protein VTK26DRAFT_3461 [Humicola hyalothermophila]